MTWYTYIWTDNYSPINISSTHIMGFSHRSVSKGSASNAWDPGLIPESERSPGKGYGNPLQYSCLESTMDRWAW